MKFMGRLSDQGILAKASPFASMAQGHEYYRDVVGPVGLEPTTKGL
jgi:hypothetical protein